MKDTMMILKVTIAKNVILSVNNVKFQKIIV